MPLVFFYGLFMDPRVLERAGVDPRLLGHAALDGHRIWIGERATVLASPSDTVYGVVMELTEAECTELYSAPSVRDYEPRAVEVRMLDSGRTIDSTCYVLPRESCGVEPRHAYALALSRLAESLGFPAAYVRRIAGDPEESPPTSDARLARTELRIDRGVSAGYMMHYVPVPDDLVEALGLSGSERVVGELNGHAFTRKLHRRHDGSLYLRFGVGWLRDAGIMAGDRLTLVLARDPDPTHVEVPPELSQALASSPVAFEAWSRFTPGRRRSLAYAIERAKRAETRQRRAERVVDDILLELDMDPDAE